MLDELVKHIAELMHEQAAAYRQLDIATTHLGTALVRGAPESIESLTRAADSTLLRMRSRLLQIMSALTKFADARASASGPVSLDPQTKRDFEAASKELLASAHDFQKTRTHATALAVGGSSFGSAFIQMCGVPPSTYNASSTRRPEANR
jgi:hypothetical protein